MGADPYLTTAQVAALFEVAPGTIRYWRHRGTGPRGVRVGRSVLYPRSSVDAWRRQTHLMPEPAERFRELVDVLLARKRPQDVVAWLDDHRDSIAADRWQELLEEAAADDG